MSQQVRTPRRLRFDGWVILHKRVGGWMEFPDTPRMVFRTRVEAQAYARQALGKVFRSAFRFWIIPWWYRRWKIVPFKSLCGGMPKMVQDALEAAPANHVFTLETELPLDKLEAAEDRGTFICECGATWCKKSLRIPMGLYDEIRETNCIIRHKDCSSPPECGDVFLLQFEDCQVWTDGGDS